MSILILKAIEDRWRGRTTTSQIRKKKDGVEHVTKSYVDKDGVGHTPNGEVHSGHNEHEHDPIALDCTLFLFLMMAIGQFCKQISH